MTVQMCYESMGADWTDVMKRFGGSEVIVKRFALKFLTDTTYAQMKEAVEKNDVDTAFRCAHTLKGVCLNLGFQGLYETSRDITEIFRRQSMDGCEPLLAEMEEQYRTTITALSCLKTEKDS